MMRRSRREPLGNDTIRVLLVGTGDDFGTDLDGDPSFETTRIPDLASLGPGSDQDAVVVSLDGPGPLEALEVLRLKTPAAAVLVLTSEGREADGAVALHAGAEVVGEAAGVVLGAIRDGDLPGRIAPDTFCVLLSGEARGAEVTVLSRLVEAIAQHDAGRADPVPLRVSVGSAIADPEHPVSLEDLLRTAGDRMRPGSSATA